MENEKFLYEWNVNEENYFSRIDKFLRKVLKNVPLSAVYKLFRTGKVYVNNIRVKEPSTKLNLGDVIRIIGEDLSKYSRDYKELKPTKMKLDILYEDEVILAINKPAGVSVHPGKNVHKPSLIEGLKYYGEKNGFEPFLVHRLDRDTSGVMIIAKDRNTARELSELISSHSVEKIYITLVFGKTTNMIIEEPIENQYAKTIVKPMKYFRAYLNGEKIDLSFLEIEIETGRKHQIRKHLSSKGFPIVCDKDYGDFRRNRQFTKKYELKRHFLHCKRMKFTYNGKIYDVTAPLSEDLQNIIKLIELESGRN